jgi:hypothetical protein
MTRDQTRAAARQRLGDRVAALAEKTGVAATVRAVERATGWRCGCDRRTAALNRWGR